MTTHTLLTTDISSARPTTSILRRAPSAARFVLGAGFVIFGLDGFLHFIPPPPAEAIPERVAAFGGALLQTGYMLPLIKGTEVLGGALLLANRFVALALALLAPVVVNIILFHAWLAPGESGIAVAVLVLELYLAWAYRSAYRAMLAARTNPG